MHPALVLGLLALACAPRTQLGHAESAPEPSGSAGSEPGVPSTSAEVATTAEPGTVAAQATPTADGSLHHPRPLASGPVKEAPVALPEGETQSLTVGLGVVGVACNVGGSAAECTALVRGPVIVTDYEILDGCPDRVYLVNIPHRPTYDSDRRVRPRWAVRVTEAGARGANMIVGDDATLHAAIQPTGTYLAGSPRCLVTWTGYRPPRAASVPSQR